MPNKPSTREDYLRRINLIVEYVSLHFDEKIDLGRLAEMAGFSPYHFHRIVRAYLGEPIGAFILRKRLETAAQLLRYSDLSVLDIAYRVGYEVPSSLSKGFRQYYGVSPIRYRNDKNIILMKNEKRPSAVSPDAPRMAVLEPRQAVYVRLSGLYEEMDYAGAWSRLWTYVQKHRLVEAGSCPDYIAVYHDDPQVTPSDKLRTDICLTVDREADPQGEIGVKEIPGGRYAVFLHRGPYSGLSAVYDGIYAQWLPGSGCRLRTSPGLERYLNDPEHTSPEDLLTEIYVPVE